MVQTTKDRVFISMVYIVVHNNMARSQVADGAYRLQIWRVNTIIMNRSWLAAHTRNEQRR